MTGYYDYVLGLIPVALIGVTAVLGMYGLPLEMAVPAGGGVSVAVMTHALFVNGPVDDDGDLPDAPAQPTAPGKSASGPAPNAD